MTAKMHPLPNDRLTAIRQGLDVALVQVSARLSALSDETVTAPAFSTPEGSALQSLAATFDLNGTEQELLALVAGCELDPAINGAAIAAGSGQAGVTPALAERLMGAATWDSLCPDAPLRRWRLLELRGQGPLHTRVLHLDERILQFLLGTSYLDERLQGVVHRNSGSDRPEPHPVSKQITAVWSGVQRLPLILLGGPNGSGKTATVWAAARALGAELLRLDAANIPPEASHCAQLATLLDRELALTGAVVLIEADAAQGAAAARLASLLSGPVLLAADEPPLPDRAPRVRFDYTPPDSTDRRAIWIAALGRRAEALGEHLDRLAGQFSLDPSEIEDAVAGLDPATAIDALEPALWSAARMQGRRALDGLAQRIETNATWDDLVLPADAKQQLMAIRAHLRHSWRVNGGWGWSEKSPRGLGLAALFAGASGTGKTLAAEVLASELKLDLYRIDLSQVISKYIGETEKNLARIFEAAEASGAILLFDEADALFGKRSEVKDSHDRYANIEVSYLLQRMEQYGGLAILTTNMRAALDTAFLRRLRFIINFPFPDQAARAQIWARIFPDNTPCSGLVPDQLARLNLAGGAIRSLALNATYLAAETPEPVSMKHIRRAARQEYAKLDKPFTITEQEALR